MLLHCLEPLEFLMPVNVHHLKCTVLATAIVLMAPAAFAQAFDAVRLYGNPGGQDGGTVGLAYIAGTQYQGSNERRNMILPLLDYQWASGWFAGTRNGLGHNFSSRADMQYGVRLTADLGRDESRSGALRGMGNVDIKPQAGAFFNYAASPAISLTSSLRYGSGNDGKGMVLDLGAGHAMQLAPQWRLAFGAAVSVANADHMQTYFGVTPAQSARSGYAAYSAGAGLRDARVNASLTYAINRRLTLSGALSLGTLLGDAKSSPLTRKTSAPTGVVAMGYQF
jgi:outer membrane protein